MIHAEGLSTVQTDINTVGTFNTIEWQKITTKGSSVGMQQTQASRDAAAPVVPPLATLGMKIRLSLLSLGIVMCIGGIFSGAYEVGVFGIVVILGSFMVPIEATSTEQENYDKETKHLRAAREAWVDTFQCSACAHRFVPSEAKAA